MIFTASVFVYPMDQVGHRQKQKNDAMITELQNISVSTGEGSGSFVEEMSFDGARRI